MIGIVLISHGDLARGMAHSATFFMGDSIEQMEYCCLEKDTSPEKFAGELETAIKKADSGDGVVVLADLFGGTPCNQAVLKLSDKVELIAGMNFPVLLELLTARMAGGVDPTALAESGRRAIYEVKEFLTLQKTNDVDEI